MQAYTLNELMRPHARRTLRAAPAHRDHPPATARAVARTLDRPRLPARHPPGAGAPEPGAFISAGDGTEGWQYGLAPRSELDAFFHFSGIPKWPAFEVYVFPCGEKTTEWMPMPFKFNIGGFSPPTRERVCFILSNSTLKQNANLGSKMDMLDDSSRPQPSLPGFRPIESAVALMAATGSEDRSAVFTRREVAEFILDFGRCM